MLAETVHVLIDADAYFTRLRREILAAERFVLVVGWDIDSRTRLVSERRPQDGYPATLLPFLNAVLAKKPHLHIYLLAWDYSVIYALEREFLPSVQFAARAHPRLHFVLDGSHAIGASHHQKLVTIDDRVVFIGGMDLTIRRWDTPDHRPNEAARVDPAGEPYGPIHDVQLRVTGEAAVAFSKLARERLARAVSARPGGSAFIPPLPELAPGAAPADPAPPDFCGVPVAVCRTLASMRQDQPDLREIGRLTRAALATARDYVFIENQYLTAAAAGDALAESLRKEHGAAIVVVLPQTECGWLERSSMGVLRARMLDHLRAADRHRRLHIYYPHVAGLSGCVNVHSKVILCDDRFLKIGSANLSNRSLGLDTECDLAIEAAPGDSRTAQAIRRVLARLLGEHLALTPDACERALAEAGSIVALIESRRGSERCLEPLPDDPARTPLNLEALGELVVDPERPMAADAFVKSLLPAEVRRPALRSMLATVGMVLPVVLVLALWQAMPEGWASAERLGQLLNTLRHDDAGWLYVGAVYALLGAAFVPITALIAATALVFEPPRAFAYAMSGSLLAAALSYAVGRLAGERALRYLDGPRLSNLRRRLHAHAFRATVVARLLPVGNFSAINIFAGALRVPFWRFMLGNVVGMVFGIAGLTLLADRLAATVSRPNLANVALLVVLIVVLFGSSLGLSKLFERRRKHGR